MYYAFFDTAVNGWLMEATGTDTSKADAIGLVAETGCKFFKAVSFPEQLFVGLRTEKVGNSSVIYQIAGRSRIRFPPPSRNCACVVEEKLAKRPIPAAMPSARTL